MDVWVDSADLDPFARAMALAPERLDAEMQISRDVALMEGIGYAVDFAPKEDGTLAGSIHVLTRDGWGGSYGTDLVYAWQREEGGPIEGNPFLVFEIDGRLIFARRVVQEGTHYMERSAEALEPRLEPIFGMGVERVLGGL